MHFDGFLLPKSYKVLTKKLQSSYPSWHWRVMQSLKMWHEEFGEVHSNTQKSENFFSMGSLCPKYKRFELQKYRGVIFHDTEQRCKIWINPDLVVEFGWTFIRALRNPENCTLMACFFSKHIMFQLENAEGWCKL